MTSRVREHSTTARHELLVTNCSSRDLVHARVRGANEAIEYGKDVYLASECEKEDRQRRYDRGHVRFDPAMFSLVMSN